MKNIFLAALFFAVQIFSIAQADVSFGRKVDGTYMPGKVAPTNYIKNPFCETKTSTPSLISPGVDSSYTSGTGLEGHSCDFTAGSVGDKIWWTTNTLGVGGACEAKVTWSGNASHLKAYLADGSGNMLGSATTLSNAANFPNSIGEVTLQYQVCTPNARVYVEVVSTSADVAKFGVSYSKATNVGPASNPNTFTAKVSSAGVVSDEGGSPLDWINGSCALTDTSLFTCTFTTSLFAAAPNCTVSVVDNATASAAPQAKIDTQATTSSVKVRTYYTTNISDFTKNAYQFNLSCTRSTDFVQTVVQTSQAEFSETDCPTITGSWTTGVTYTCKWSRRKNRAYFDIVVVGTGAPTPSTTLSVNLPITIDTAKMAATPSSNNPQIRGNAYIGDLGVTGFPGNLYYASTTSVGVQYISTAAAVNNPTYYGQVSTSAPFSFNTGDFVNLKFDVPVVGWIENPMPAIPQGVIGSTTVMKDLNAITSVDYGLASVTTSAGTNAVSLTSPASCNYSRVGSTVNASCKITTNCTTAAGTATYVNITPPVATTQGSTIFGTVGSTNASETGYVMNNGNNAYMIFKCQYNGGADTRMVTFSYQVP